MIEDLENTFDEMESFLRDISNGNFHKKVFLSSSIPLKSIAIELEASCQEAAADILLS